VSLNRSRHRNSAQTIACDGHFLKAVNIQLTNRFNGHIAD